MVVVFAVLSASDVSVVVGGAVSTSGGLTCMLDFRRLPIRADGL